jgi:nicotinate phosphoribosyltransferase
MSDKIIQSMLDDDLYKFSTQWAILNLFPETIAEYHFFNRGKHRFTPAFIKALRNEIDNEFPKLALTKEEEKWFSSKCKYLPQLYFDYLRNYRYKPEQVQIALTEDNDLNLTVKGPWKETILWEVKLMSVISELYFKINTNWTMNGQIEKINEKGKILEENNCALSEFGSRRRRSYEVQDLVIRELKKYKNLTGTSNVHFAMKNDIIPQGSYPHEWVQGNAVIESLQHPDYYAMHNWSKIFNSLIGTALSETYGFKSFLRNFNIRLSKLFNGIRNDSGDPFDFVDKTVQHYTGMGIDPMSKFIIFSNALDTEKILKIKEYCSGKIKCAFGVGTFLTNDFLGSPALNMVIKLFKIDNMYTVKLSDDNGKEMGDPETLKIMKWIHRGEPL